MNKNKILSQIKKVVISTKTCAKQMFNSQKIFYLVTDDLNKTQQQTNQSKTVD